MKNIRKFLLPLSVLAICLGVGILALSTINFSPVQAQAVYQTPTPDAEGRIYYTVEENDNCTRVFLLTNVPIDEIIRLNGLDDDCTLITGTKILLGTVEAPSLTETAMPTATIAPELITPTPTPAPGFAKVCVVLFNDLDGTGMRTEGETYLYGGVVSLNDRLGKVSLTGNTVAGNPDEVDPLCFEDIPEGSYNITVAIPDGFNATTITNYPLDVKAGEQATVDFGAQVATAAPEEATASTGRSPVLGIVGLVILVAGLVLGFSLWRQRKV
ncbi:MAG: LysM domain-containing protein [Anaerolineaceae bacterium]